MPYTLLPTPYALHLTPYTLYPILHTFLKNISGDIPKPVIFRSYLSHI